MEPIQIYEYVITSPPPPPGIFFTIIALELFLGITMQRWTLQLEGGPCRVNHAAVAYRDSIFTFGGYCTGEDYNITRPMDTHRLNTGLAVGNIYYIILKHENLEVSIAHVIFMTMYVLLISFDCKYCRKCCNPSDHQHASTNVIRRTQLKYFKQCHHCKL